MVRHTTTTAAAVVVHRLVSLCTCSCCCCWCSYIFTSCTIPRNMRKESKKNPPRDAVQKAHS
jgi:hypothetical protein